VPGAYGATVTVTPGSNWVMQMAAFKASVQPSSPPPPPPAGGFNLSASPGSAAVSAGQSASYTITVTPQNGFTGTVSLTCSGGPSQSQCSVTPASVTAGSTATLTVSTTAASAGLLHPGRTLPLYAMWIVLPGMALVAAGRAAGSRKRRMLLLLFLTGLMGFIALQVSCGGGGSSSPPPPSAGGTPAGTYTITVTAISGTTQSSVPVTLTVQ
jgi:hypothetical protein